MLLVLTVSCGAGGGSGEPMDDRPPSVILISLDTCRADHMSLYGYGRSTTPYLERLAEECVVFENARTVAPWTLISHVSMLTGLYPEQHGVVDQDLSLNPKIPLLAQQLKDQGYEAFAFFKPGFIGERYGHDRGFDVFIPHEFADQAKANMDQVTNLGRRRPFFLFLHLFDIHSDSINVRNHLKYNPPEPYDRIFMPDAKERLEGVNFTAITAGKGELTADQNAAMVSLYDGKIRYVDAVLEMWVEQWRQDGMLEDTLLIITSDHGEALGDRNGRIKGHGKLWEDALHIPMLVRFPDGYRAGEREPGLVSIVDVVPTVLEEVEYPLDQPLPGRSLRRKPDANRVVGAVHSSLYAHISYPWKVKGAQGSPTEVFNLEDDPGELNRIVDLEIFKQVTEELDVAYQSMLEAHRDLEAEPIPVGPEDTHVLQNLKELGYGGGSDD